MIQSGCVLPSWLPDLTGFSGSDTALAFASILLQTFPFLLLGAIFSASLDQFVPDGWLVRLLGGRGLQGRALAVLAGLVLPICECGALPLVRRLLQKKVPVPVATTYLLASSILNPACLLSTWMAFKGRDPFWMLGWRVVLGLTLVLLMSWIISRWKPEHLLRSNQADDLTQSDHSECGHDHGHSHDHPPEIKGHDCCGDHLHGHEQASMGSWKTRLNNFVCAVTEDFLGVAAYLVVGAACAAVLSTSVNRTLLDPWLGNSWLAPVLTIGLAQVLCLCSTTDAFIIAAFPHAPAHAALAFLVAGPLFDFKLLWAYRSLFQWRVVGLIALVSTGGAYLLCMRLAP